MRLNRIPHGSPGAYVLLAGAVLVTAIAAFTPSPGLSSAPVAEFHFIRLEYTDLPQYHRRFGYSSRDGRGAGWWMMDWPDADEHFTLGIRRLTRIHTGEPRHLRLTDERLFDHPWIYATQVGWWDFTDAETITTGSQNGLLAGSRCDCRSR